MLGIISLAIYISLENSTFDYRLDPAWWLDQRTVSSNKWRQIAPVLTDLDGDGSKELVVITKDLELMVLSAAIPPDHIREKIYTPKRIATTKLTHFGIKKGRTPVIMKTGYIDQYNEKVGRSQVIVIVREDWTVSCYNSHLESLWEKSIAHKVHEVPELADLFEIGDVSVFFTSLSVKEIQANSTSSKPSGMVIIGASMSLRDHTAHIKVEQGIREKEMRQKDKGAAWPEHLDMNIRASLEHYTVYSLDGHDGSVIWQHDGSEVKAEQFVRSLPQHAYRLDTTELAQQLHHRAGINDWTVFRQSLLAEVPHSWRFREDGSSSMKHFERRHIGIGAGQQVHKRKILAGTKAEHKKKRAGNMVVGHGRFTGVETEPLADNAVLPHHASEHTHNPNVLVAHTRRGIEVLALRTGLPLTSLALAPDRTYADVDGDGVVDTIMVLETMEDVAAHGQAFAHEGGELQHCSVMVLSGLPPHSQLFNGTVCKQRHSIHDPLNKINSKLPDDVAGATPLVLQVGNSSDSRGAKVMDVVIAMSMGFLTCYTGRGQFKWQVVGSPTWIVDRANPIASLHVSVSPYDWDATRVEETGTHDSRFAQILVLGDSSVAVISREGNILAQADIPKKPITRAVLGDFDGDGIVDIVIVTEDAILGYRMEVAASARGMLIAILVLVVLAGIIFVANLKSDVVVDNRVGGKQKNVLSIVRSTDEWHID